MTGNSVSSRFPIPYSRPTLFGFQHGQKVARWILEPGDSRTAVAVDSLGVRLELAVFVNLEANAAVGELIDRSVHVVDRKVQNRKRRRRVVRLFVHEDLGVVIDGHIERT